MNQLILTSLLIVAVVLPPLILGGWSMDLLMLFCIVAGSYEIVHCLSLPYRKSLIAGLILTMVLLSRTSPQMLGGGLAAALVVLFALAIFEKHTPAQRYHADFRHDDDIYHGGAVDHHHLSG